ncbi:MAG: hypothetical protein JWN65_2285 [Solirubrobacterales bacterium]|nr:hypothetical protein [Solirubrobacterales bacterium]
MGAFEHVLHDEKRPPRTRGTAAYGNGYMDGAVRSGSRAAKEALGDR